MKKNILTLALAVLLSGCTTYTYLQGPGTPPQQQPSRTSWSLVNSTLFLVDVFVDGVLMRQNVKPGQVVGIVRPSWQMTTTVAVTGKTPDGSFAGSETHIFYDAPEVWNVVQLLKP